MTTGHWLNLTDRKSQSFTMQATTMCAVVIVVTPILAALMLGSIAIKSIEKISK